MAYTEFYCNASTGSNMNGGSDENTSPSYSATNGGWNSATGVFTPTSGDPSASVTVGQFANVFVDGATTPVFVSRVTAVSSTTVTVSTTAMSGTAPTTAGTGISINVGGVWKGPNGTVSFPFDLASAAMTSSAGDMVRVNLKNNATYSVTAQVSRTAGGGIVFQGYSSTVGDLGKAVIDGGTSGASYIVLYVSGSGLRTICCDLTVQNNGATGSADGIEFVANSSYLLRVKVKDVRGDGINLTAGHCISCEVTGANQSNTASGSGIKCGGNNSLLVGCVAWGNSGSNTSGISFTSTSNIVQQAINCIAYNNGLHGFFVNNRNGFRLLQNCDAYLNGGDGIRLTAITNGSSVFIANCNLLKNSGYGINRTDSLTDNAIVISHCGFGSGGEANTSGKTNGIPGEGSINEVNYASGVTPWTDPTNRDFSISLAAAKNVGVLSLIPETVAYPDIGAAQHIDSGSSSVKGMRILGG